MEQEELVICAKYSLKNLTKVPQIRRTKKISLSDYSLVETKEIHSSQKPSPSYFNTTRLTIADIVQIGDKWFLCDYTGWLPINAPTN